MVFVGLRRRDDLIPQLLLKDSNTGIFGYGANALTAVALSWAAERFVSSNAGKGVLIGGAVMLGGRLISDFFGCTSTGSNRTMSGARSV